MTEVLRNALSGLCCGTGYNYVAFWKEKKGNSRLNWEDGYYDERLPDVVAKKGRTDVNCEKLEDAYTKMAWDLHSMGEGVIGGVAFSGKYQWITAPADTPAATENAAAASRKAGKSPRDRYPVSWKAHFDAGIRTISVISVARGVLQFASIDKLREDPLFVVSCRIVFDGLANKPGAFLSDLMEDSTLPAQAFVSIPPHFPLLPQHQSLQTYMPMTSMTAFSNAYPPSVPHSGLLPSHLFPPTKAAMIIPPRISLSEIAQRTPVKGSGGSSASKGSRRSVSMAGSIGTSLGKFAKAPLETVSLAAGATKGKIKRAVSAAGAGQSAVQWPAVDGGVRDAAMQADVAGGLLVGTPVTPLSAVGTPLAASSGAFQQQAFGSPALRSVGQGVMTSAGLAVVGGGGGRQEPAMWTSRSQSLGFDLGGQTLMGVSGGLLQPAPQLPQVGMAHFGALPHLHELPPRSATPNPLLMSAETSRRSASQKQMPNVRPSGSTWSGEAGPLDSTLPAAAAVQVVAGGRARSAKRQASEVPLNGLGPPEKKWREAPTPVSLNRISLDALLEPLPPSLTAEQSQLYDSLFTDSGSLEQLGSTNLGMTTTEAAASLVPGILQPSPLCDFDHGLQEPVLNADALSTVPRAPDPCFSELASALPAEVLMPSRFDDTASLAAEPKDEASAGFPAADDHAAVVGRAVAELPARPEQPTNEPPLWSPHVVRESGMADDLLDVRLPEQYMIDNPAMPLPIESQCPFSMGAGPDTLTSPTDQTLLAGKGGYVPNTEDDEGFWAVGTPFSDAGLHGSVGTESGEEWDHLDDASGGQAPELLPMGDSEYSSPADLHPVPQLGAISLPSTAASPAVRPELSAGLLSSEVPESLLAFATGHAEGSSFVPSTTAHPDTSAPISSATLRLPGGTHMDPSPWQWFTHGSMSLPSDCAGLEALLNDPSMSPGLAGQSHQQREQQGGSQAGGVFRQSFSSCIPAPQADARVKEFDLPHAMGSAQKRVLAAYDVSVTGGGLYQLQQQQKTRRVNHSAEALRQVQSQVRIEQQSRGQEVGDVGGLLYPGALHQGATGGQAQVSLNASTHQNRSALKQEVQEANNSFGIRALYSSPMQVFRAPDMVMSSSVGALHSQQTPLISLPPETAGLPPVTSHSSNPADVHQYSSVVSSRSNRFGTAFASNASVPSWASSASFSDFLSHTVGEWVPGSPSHVQTEWATLSAGGPEEDGSLRQFFNGGSSESNLHASHLPTREIHQAPLAQQYSGASLVGATTYHMSTTNPVNYQQPVYAAAAPMPVTFPLHQPLAEIGVGRGRSHVHSPPLPSVSPAPMPEQTARLAPALVAAAAIVPSSALVPAPAPVLTTARVPRGRGGRGKAEKARLASAQIGAGQLGDRAGDPRKETKAGAGAKAGKGKKGVAKANGDKPKQRPRDRQQIQERMDALRLLMGPDFTKDKMNIDGLLERAVWRMEFLRAAKQQAPVVDLAQAAVDQICGGRLGTPQKLVTITDIIEPRNYLFIEVFLPCKDKQLEVADALHKLNLLVRKGWTEWQDGKLWAQFIVEDIVKAAAARCGGPDTSASRDRPRLYSAIMSAAEFRISAPQRLPSSDLQRPSVAQMALPPRPFSHTRREAAVLQSARRQQSVLGGAGSFLSALYLTRPGGF